MCGLEMLYALTRSSLRTTTVNLHGVWHLFCYRGDRTADRTWTLTLGSRANRQQRPHRSTKLSSERWRKADTFRESSEAQNSGTVWKRRREPNGWSWSKAKHQGKSRDVYHKLVVYTHLTHCLSKQQRTAQAGIRAAGGSRRDERKGEGGERSSTGPAPVSGSR
jgi:hypothetical protein